MPSQAASQPEEERLDRAEQRRSFCSVHTVKRGGSIVGAGGGGVGGGVGGKAVSFHSDQPRVSAQSQLVTNATTSSRSCLVCSLTENF